MTDWAEVTATDGTFAETQHETAEIANPSFEIGITGTWNTWTWKTYPTAIWRRVFSTRARSGEYVMEAVFQKAGANYRGNIAFYQTNIDPVEGHQYRVRAYVLDRGRAGAIYTLTLQVYSAGTLNESTVLASTAIPAGWHPIDVTFAAPSGNVSIYLYCAASDANSAEKPVFADDISITNLTRAPTWTEQTVSDISASVVAHPWQERVDYAWWTDKTAVSADTDIDPEWEVES